MAGLSLTALAYAAPAAAGAAEQAAVVGSIAAVAAADATVLDDVVVTARRREENIQDVPIAITALSADTLAKNEQIRLAQDVVSFAPNINSVATDGRERPRWFIRGVGTNNTDPNGVSPVGVYRDEVYIANFYAQAFPIFDQQRVEILSGPQGTLWGKNTTGGAINFVSKTPGFDTSGYARAVVGSFGEKGLEGAVGGSIIPGLLAGRIAVFHNSDKGWNYNVYAADVTPPNATAWRLEDRKRIGANNESALRAQLLFTPTPDVDVTLNYHLRRYKGDQNPSYILPDLYIAPVNNPTFNQGYTSPNNPLPYGYSWFAGNAEQTIDNDGGLLRVDWRISEGLKFTSITGYEQNKLVRWADGSTSIPLHNNASRQITPDRQISQEFRLASSESERLTWIAGAFYFKEDTVSESAAANLNVFTAPAAGRSYSLTYTSTDTESFAAFGSATLDVTDRFKLTVGGRATREEKTFSQAFTLGTGPVSFRNNNEWWLPASVASTLVTNSVASVSKTYDALTWDITPEYRINDRALAYFHYSYGYLSGGFNNRRNNSVTPAIQQIFEYQPEKIHTYEAGLKTTWLDGRLTANAAAFYYDYPSIQVLVILPTTGTNTNSTATVGNGYSNAAGEVKGFELTLEANPVDNLRLRAALGLLDSKYTDFPVQTGINYPRQGLVNATIDPTGNTFTRAPKRTLSLGANYTIPLFDETALELGGEYRYLSRQYFSPTLAAIDPTLEQGAYGLVNANAALTFGARGQHRLSVSVQNATDKEYLIHAIAPSNNGSSAKQGRPRSYLVSLTTTF
ncbi:TonB-dependent receptor [Phenylobacterium sp.]|uniref:TonB-dependent receptor n=1 Tax=Phenylobacterium sp. TaxID=1871053 RepID=UPI0037851154